ncbi:hypothetical protein [Pseudonocardia adelaidensis]|uniref:Uncharacterized protein n=1 Tax=Pseudonocardia adelaidensis TaxID=648754 RepID=A0ABP9NQN7_9PSEU
MHDRISIARAVRPWAQQLAEHRRLPVSTETIPREAGIHWHANTALEIPGHGTPTGVIDVASPTPIP